MLICIIIKIWKTFKNWDFSTLIYYLFHIVFFMEELIKKGLSTESSLPADTASVINNKDIHKRSQKI